MKPSKGARYHLYWFLSHYLSQSSPPTYALSYLHRPPRVVSSSTLPRPCYYKRYSHNYMVYSGAYCNIGYSPQFTTKTRYTQDTYMDTFAIHTWINPAQYTPDTSAIHVYPNVFRSAPPGYICIQYDTRKSMYLPLLAACARYDTR